MFGFEDNEKPLTKCYAMHGPLPSYVDASHPPRQKSPFSTILAHSFNHTVELFIPEEAYAVISAELENSLKEAKFSKVIMTLSDLLHEDFFNFHLKSGNVLMLSEGRAGVDRTFSLCDGTLRLLLDRETYERAGLEGTPTGTTGTKRMKSRWVVEINLRLPSMFPGRKGFERIVWAFKNVLTQPVTWLFCDLDPKESSPGPTAKHHPIHRVAEVETFRTGPHLVPPLHPPAEEGSANLAAFDEYVADSYEWLGMLSLQSPRVLASDTVDPYLSRYEVPASATAVPTNLVRLRWRGLLPARWITGLWLTTLSVLVSVPSPPVLTLGPPPRRLSRTLAPSAWYALSVDGFSTGYPDGTNCYTVLRLPPSASKSDGSVTEAGELELDPSTLPDTFLLCRLDSR